jgi:hypothetical protein
MPLSKRKWKLVGAAVSFVCYACGEKRLRPVVDLLGVYGEHGAANGLDPFGSPPRHEIIHALRALVVAADRLDGRHVPDDLLKALVHAEDVLQQCDHGAPVR